MGVYLSKVTHTLFITY